ncbi:alpha-N-acetylgalactosamine-specific lectin isoform X1 [Strongylocentrotus purpuratus]|uniref:C-type lectin domain-containing protein n=2 Tax=Strongylocentrotus purpuratus TaxID=7668 RepID=A0A7M7NMZ3_STRPU|nr:alpha-N-acetylgalactosamine-specific lectin isoform X1 [Strongylocentrotus purpuratus]
MQYNYYEVINMKLLLASMAVLAVTVYGLDANVCHPCPQFWLPFNGSCYRYFGERVTWGEARDQCRDHYSLNGRADLVSIHTEKENAFAYNLFRSPAGITPDHVTAGPPYYGAWIGAYKTTPGSTGPFIWSDGSGLNFEQWFEGQPSNWEGNEDCVHLWRKNAEDDILQSWNDLFCERDLPFICKVAPN